MMQIVRGGLTCKLSCFAHGGECQHSLRSHHGFAALASDDVVATFRSSHPLTSPSHYKTYTERIAKGEPP